MKRKNILSALLSVTMLASTFTGLTASAEKTTSGQAPEGLPSNWTKVYGEDFEGYAASTPESKAAGSVFEIKNADGTVVNTDWKYWGSNVGDTSSALPSHGFIARTSDDQNTYIVRNAKWTTYQMGYTLNGLSDLPAENQIEFDLGSTQENKNASAVYARINMSADGKSYYEIGHIGGQIAKYRIPYAPFNSDDGTPIIVTHTKQDGTVTTYNYPVKYKVTTTVTDSEGNELSSETKPASDYNKSFTRDTCNLTDSVVTNEETGETTTITHTIVANADYIGHAYFVMVRNGTPVYVKWGSAANFYNGVFNGDWVHVTLKSTADGINYEMMPSDSYFEEGTEKTPLLSGVCKDTSLAGTGIPFMFGGGGWEGGTRLDNLAIYTDAGKMSENAPYNDDFTEYEADKTVTDLYSMTSGQMTIAEHPSGAKWVTSKAYLAGWMTYRAKFSDGIYAVGAGDGWANVYLDLGDRIDSYDKMEMLVAGRKRVSGMSAFISSNEKNMLVFGIGGEDQSTWGVGKPGSSKPFAAVMANGSDEGSLVVVQQPDANFRNNENVKYTVERLDNKTIKWTADGMTSGATTGGIITSDTARAAKDQTDKTLSVVYNKNIEDIISKAYYGMGIMASGDTNGSTTKTARVWYTGEIETTPPSFTDDFTEYTADNAVTKDNMWKLTDGEKVLATGTNSDGHKWQYVTSAKWTGKDGTRVGNAYIDTSEKAIIVSGKGISTYGSVKIDLGEGIMKSLEKIQAKAVSFDRMGMLNAFINQSETSFLTFGLRGDVGNGMSMAVYNRLPVVALRTSDGWQILAKAVQDAETNAWSYECADGVTAKIEDTWAKWNDWNGSYNTTWTVKVKSDNSVAFTAECDKGGRVTGTISADIIEPLLENMRYPMAFMAAGDNPSTFKNVKVWYTKDEAQPRISDSFTDYTADNAVTTKYRLIEGKKILATGTNDEGHKWQYITSRIWNGDWSKKGDASGSAYISTADKTLTFAGAGDTADGMVLFDLGRDAVESVQKVNAKIKTNVRVGALNLFVSNDEKSYLTFAYRNQLTMGIKQNEDGSWVTGDAPSTLGVKNRYPTVALYKNGVRTILAQAVQDETTNAWSYDCADGVTAKLEKDFENTATPMDWTITVNDDGSINYVAKGDNGGKMSGTISADIVSEVMSNYRYPMSFQSGGDGNSQVSKVKLWYTPNDEYEEPLFYDDFEYYRNDDDTITQDDTEEGIKLIDAKGTHEGTYTGHRMASGPAVLAANAESGAKWITSGVWTANYSDPNSGVQAVYPGLAYINTSAKALQVLGCNLGHIAAVNLDMGENKKFTDLHKVTFTMQAPARNAGVRLFVSGNEKYFLEFGFTGGEESRYGMTYSLDAEGNKIQAKDATTGELKYDDAGNPVWQREPIARYSPMIRKSVNPGIQADSRYWTSAEMNASKDSLIYAGSVYGTMGDANGIDNENTTITTDGKWLGQDSAITYTIEISEDGIVTWDAKGSASGHSCGVIDDEQVKALVKANWVYPAAFASGGDGQGTKLSEIALYGATEDISYDTMYEKKAYSQSEFAQMYKDADYGRDAQVQALLKLDLSDVISEEKAAVDVNVTAENDSTAKNVLTGTHYEFADNYDKFYDADGQLLDSYKKWAKSQSPISTLRIGGGSSGAVNMWKDLNGQDSTYVSFPESKKYEQVQKTDEDGNVVKDAKGNVIMVDKLVPKTDENGNEVKDADGNVIMEKVSKIGKTSTKRYKMGVAETINAFKVNNPNMSFVLAVSPNTTTPEEVGKLVKALIGTDDDSKEFRLEKFGSQAPVNLYAIELGNEIDGGKGKAEHADLIGWYLDISNDMIDQIKANDPTGKVKIIACGPTAPWGSDSDWGSMTSAKRWVAQLADGTNDTTYGTHSGIADRIDAMAFHAYYYGINPENVLDQYAKPLYDILADKGYGKVKLSMTEHAVFWHAENNYYATPKNSGLFAGLANAYFIVKSANGGYTDSGYNHSTVGTSGMYARWQYSGKDKKFHANPETTAYNVLSDAWSDNGIYKTTFNVTNDVTDAYQNALTSMRFEATTVKVSDDTINLILVNNQGYTQVDANITLPAEFKDFKLSKEITYTAPNMYSFMFDTETADLATVKTKEYDNPEVFGSRVYTVPNKSMVVLTLTGNASQLLKDEFNYSDTDPIEPGFNDEGSPVASDIAANSNGTKWVTSTANLGYDANVTTFGNAKISNDALVVSNAAGAIAKMGANWDISGYKEKPTGINKITFTTTNTGTTGGVMLFVKTTAGTDGLSVEESKFDFSNETCGLNGTVNWTVTIANNKLSWSAVDENGTTVSSETPMDITDEEMTNYDYFAQVYVNGSAASAGSVALDKIDVSYGADAPEIKDIISYTKGTDALNITIDPSAASEAISVWVGYYNSGKLVKVIPAGNYEAGAEAVNKPVDLPADGQTAKIFVWKTISGAEPVQGSITVK